MVIKKTNGKIFGAVLTAAERKAMNIEIQKEFAEYDRKNCEEIDAMILVILQDQFGFTEEQLKWFYTIFEDYFQGLCERYEMNHDKEEAIWLYTHLLKQRGIDISKWRKDLPNA